MKKILVIDNRDSFVYNIVEYLRRMPEVEVQVVCDDGKTSLPCTDNFWGIVLSPGAGIPEEGGFGRSGPGNDARIGHLPWHAGDGDGFRRPAPAFARSPARSSFPFVFLLG